MAKKRLNLALQGGGAHGAFTWGVLDRLLEEPDLELVALCGTSAGAMNGAVAAHGLAVGGPAGAKACLERFWHRVSQAASLSPIRPGPIDWMLGPGSMDFSPGWMAFDNLTRMLSPYQFNPAGFNPLRTVLQDVVDFAALAEQCAAELVRLFLCATNVKTGRIKVFKGAEVSIDAVMASACLPFVFQAVEIDGEHYWDGGYMGNPPLFPLIYETDCPDILIIQINPINIEEVPTTAQAIYDRINTLSFNSSLMREMRAIHFVTKLIDEGRLDPEHYKRLNIHTIDAEDEMRQLGASSKLNADHDFLAWLKSLGRARAAAWLDAHGQKIGHDSSTDIAAKFL